MEQNITIDSLYKGCKAGKREAQERLYRMTASRMYGLCLRYANTTFEAEDMMQAGYIKVFNHIHAFRGDGSFEGWIKRIMVNTALSMLRKNSAMQETIDITEITDAGMPVAEAVDHMAYDDLLQVIQQLPHGYRMVFNLHVMEGFSHREIAEMLHISESTSKSQLLRARNWLQKRIEKQEGAVYGK